MIDCHTPPFKWHQNLIKCCKYQAQELHLFQQIATLSFLSRQKNDQKAYPQLVAHPSHSDLPCSFALLTDQRVSQSYLVGGWYGVTYPSESGPHWYSPMLQKMYSYNTPHGLAYRSSEDNMQWQKSAILNNQCSKQSN